MPHRPESRKAALEWLNGERFQVFLARAPASATDVQRACSALALIEQSLAAWDEAVRPDLHPLLYRFEALGEAAGNDAGGNVPAAQDATQTGTAIKQGEIGSSRDLLDRGREMAVFLRRQAEGYLPAYRLLRCVRWDTVTSPPPHDGQGRTRLPPPRQDLQQHLKRLVLQQQWHELLERVELAFAEGANHFWLDLQYLAWQAQGQAGPLYAGWQDMLLTDFAQMRDRLAGVERLSFSDGTPFADDSTLEWISRHAVIRDLEAGDSIVQPPPGVSDSDWQNTVELASATATEKGLEAAWQWVRDLPHVPGAHQQCLRTLLMAQLAEQHGRSDMALHLLTELDGMIETFRLDQWAPALAFEIKAQQWRVLQQRAQRKDVDKITLQQRLEHVHGALAALDPVRTLSLGLPTR
ncbi:type VI secretion-associated protein [Silvimonas iriomotensis]|uniref:Type VI secretion-associated protein n=1 Tax=Silvimonas iriomotensis TaxID=449662 RepID=A0ABQ2P4Q0_9NEIS|nr:type VI secretion-associated protein [Silvimonas iriomotensis]